MMTQNLGTVKAELDNYDYLSKFYEKNNPQQSKIQMTTKKFLL